MPSPTHVVADSFYGFIYTKDEHGMLFTDLSATQLAEQLNESMPEGMRDYAVYHLIPVKSPTVLGS